MQFFTQLRCLLLHLNSLLPQKKVLTAEYLRYNFVRKYTYTGMENSYPKTRQNTILIISLITVKAPNIDGVFMKNVFYSLVLLGDTLFKNSTRGVKSRLFYWQNQNFNYEFIELLNKFPKVSKLPSGLLSSTGRNNFRRSYPPEKSVWQL
jgi:hypothetical protein